MPAGKPNNLSSRLEAMPVPEGFRLDAANTWQRLEEMMGRPRRKRVRYGYLAAALFAFVSLSLMVFLNSETPLPEGRMLPAGTAIEINFYQEVHGTPAKEITPEITLLPAYRTNRRAPRIPTDRPVAADPALIAAPVAEKIPADTVAASVPAKPAPRFRVAHINEMDKPAPPRQPAYPSKKPPAFVEEEISPDEEPPSTRKKRPSLFLTSSSQ